MFEAKVAALTEELGKVRSIVQELAEQNKVLEEENRQWRAKDLLTRSLTQNTPPRTPFSNVAGTMNASPPKSNHVAMDVDINPWGL